MSQELRQRLDAALRELYAPEPAPTWRVKEAMLQKAVSVLEHNLSVLRWLKKARLVGALELLLRERKRRIEREAGAA